MSLSFDQFVKNLSPSQINLSAIKGEGELTDLELNEVGWKGGYLQTWSSMRLAGGGVELTDLELNEVGWYCRL